MKDSLPGLEPEPSCCVLIWWKGWGIFLFKILFCKMLLSFMRASLHDLSASQRPHILIQSPVELGFQYMNFEEFQTIAETINYVSISKFKTKSNGGKTKPNKAVVIHLPGKEVPTSFKKWVKWGPQSRNATNEGWGTCSTLGDYSRKSSWLLNSSWLRKSLPWG